MNREVLVRKIKNAVLGGTIHTLAVVFIIYITSIINAHSVDVFLWIDDYIFLFIATLLISLLITIPFYFTRLITLSDRPLFCFSLNLILFPLSMIECEFFRSIFIIFDYCTSNLLFSKEIIFTTIIVTLFIYLYDTRKFEKLEKNSRGE